MGTAASKITEKNIEKRGATNGKHDAISGKSYLWVDPLLWRVRFFTIYGKFDQQKILEKSKRNRHEEN